jgi:hypothetical protein
MLVVTLPSDVSADRQTSASEELRGGVFATIVFLPRCPSEFRGGISTLIIILQDAQQSLLFMAVVTIMGDEYRSRTKKTNVALSFPSHHVRVRDY